MIEPVVHNYHFISFQKAAPMLYTALLVTIKTASSVAVFKKRLKTYLFTKTCKVYIDIC